MTKTFLVGSHSGLFKVEVSKELELLSCSRINSGHHYGISVDLNEGLVYSKNQDAYMNIYELPDVVRIDKLEFGSAPGHVHQALVANHGVYFTDTVHNRLSFRHQDGRHDHLEFDGKKEDFNHVNSIFFQGDSIAVLLHNRGNKNSEIAVVNHSQKGFEEIRRVCLNDTGCHNIYIKDGIVTYNASAAGNTIRFDIDGERELNRLQFNGHTKGLSVLDDHIVIGVSEHAERAERESTSSGIAFLERNSGELLHFLPLMESSNGSALGNINEIRSISHADYSEGVFIGLE